MNGKMSMQAEREVPLLVQRKPVATLNEYTGQPVMKSAHWAYESAAAAAHELPPDGGTKAALCAAYSAFTNVKTEFSNCRFVDTCLMPSTRLFYYLKTAGILACNSLRKAYNVRAIRHEEMALHGRAVTGTGECVPGAGL